MAENINNIFLKNNIYSILDKKENENITLDELKMLECIVLNDVSEKLERIQYTLDDFETIKYVKKLVINKLIITNDIILKINNMKNLKSLTLNSCIFLSDNKINNNNIEFLVINSPVQCDLKLNFEIHNVKQLILIDINDVNIENMLDSNILKLYIYNCNIINDNCILQLNKLQELRLDGSKFNREIESEIIRKKITCSFNKKYYIN